MMGGGRFIWLKVGYGRGKTAKQPEIRLASLPTILWILRSTGRNYRITRAMVVPGQRFP
jgi:hypothetical protein